MTQVHRSALVPRPAALLYSLVNDVEAYPKRFAWCSGASVLERGTDELVVRLDLRLGAVGTSFTTRNRLVPNESIAIDLVEGPFANTGTVRFSDEAQIRDIYSRFDDLVIGWSEYSLGDMNRRVSHWLIEGTRR